VSDVIEIQPGRAAQVHNALRTGHRVVVPDDVKGVARTLKEIDPGLRLSYFPDQELWIIDHVKMLEDGSVEESLVTTCEGELDPRLVERIRQIASPDYDYAAELDRLERDAQRREEALFTEKRGPILEKLAWAFTRDLGRHETPRTRSSRAVVPGDVPKGA
jgi:hypothetical protein